MSLVKRTSVRKFSYHTSGTYDPFLYFTYHNTFIMWNTNGQQYIN